MSEYWYIFAVLNLAQWANNIDEETIFMKYSEKLNRATPFVCPICNKWYTYKTTLNRHLKFECGKEPQFRCPHCIYRASQKNNMIRHIKTHHSSWSVNDMLIFCFILNMILLINIVLFLYIPMNFRHTPWLEEATCTFSVELELYKINCFTGYYVFRLYMHITLVVHNYCRQEIDEEFIQHRFSAI